MGCAGRVANGINTVHLSYVRQYRGHGLIGFRQWIPREQIEDPAVRERMGLPAGPGVRDQGRAGGPDPRRRLRRRMVADFVCGDEVYGNCPALRCYLEEHGQGYVLRVAKTFLLSLGGGRPLSCAGVVSTCLRSRRRWMIASAGSGSKANGLRLGVDHYRQPAALAAGPPASDHRRMRLPLLPRPGRPAGLLQTADHRGRAALAGRGELRVQQGLLRA